MSLDIAFHQRRITARVACSSCGNRRAGLRTGPLNFQQRGFKEKMNMEIQCSKCKASFNAEVKNGAPRFCSNCGEKLQFDHRLTTTRTTTVLNDLPVEVERRRNIHKETHLPGNAVGRVAKIAGTAIELTGPFGAALVKTGDIVFIEDDICRIEDRFALLGGSQSIIVDHVPPGCTEGSLLYLKQIEFRELAS
jgi:DNA-directed RNA polymerase subunit RPC12/RpoP